MCTNNEGPFGREMPGMSGIGDNVQSQTAFGICPGDELAGAMIPVCRHGVTVSDGQRAGGVTVDLTVTGSRGTFGVICDAIDAGRLQREPRKVAGLAMDRIYCVSAVDTLVDPRGVVSALSRMEPGYFRNPSSSESRGSRSRVHVSRVEIPDRVALPWDSALVPFRAAGESARAA